MSEGVQEWVDAWDGELLITGSMFLSGWTFKKKKEKTAYQIVRSTEGVNFFLLISLHLSLSLMSTCSEIDRQLFVCIFCLKSSPAAHIHSS